MEFELELMVLCSRSDLDRNRIERLKQLIAKKIDWNVLFNIAIFRKVFPLCYQNIAKYCPDSIPADIHVKFRKQYLQIAADNLSFSRQLIFVLELFEKNNITAVPFKGPVLAEYLFGDINCRSYVDLDVLVAKTDLRKAVSVLLENGYRFDIDLNFDQYMQLALAGFHARMINTKLSCMVELHWEMSGRYFWRTLELHDIKSRIRKIGFMEHQVLSLCPEDLLVYLCIHGNRHRWMQLDFISCVAGLLEKAKELDWDLAFQQAGRFGAKRMLMLGCFLAREVLDSKLNSAVDGEIEKDSVVRDVGSMLIGNLCSGLAEKRRELTYWQKVQYNRQTMDNVTDWFLLSMQPLLQPTHSDWEWLRLPASMSRLYYVLRPLRLGVKYSKKLIHPGGKG